MVPVKLTIAASFLNQTVVYLKIMESCVTGMIIRLPELVGLLRQIEEAAHPVYIKRLELKRRYDDRSRFDALIIAGSVAPA